MLTVMWHRNCDLFLWFFFKEKKGTIAKTGENMFKPSKSTILKTHCHLSMREM